MPTFELATEGMPDPMRVSEQPTEAELDDGSDDAW